jgi:hypothetical protein
VIVPNNPDEVAEQAEFEALIQEWMRSTDWVNEEEIDGETTNSLLFFPLVGRR